MVLSSSSERSIDPLSDVLDLLGARVTRQTRMEAAGRWALAFTAIERLKFVALLRGSQWLLVPGHAPQQLDEGDICLIGRTAYVAASDPAQRPVDGGAMFTPGCDVVRLGGDDMVAVGGTVTFTDDHADFLLDMLPVFMVVPRASPGAEAVATILALMNAEAGRTTIGGDIVTARLADLLLVEAIRAGADHPGMTNIGWLAALSDPRLGRALRAIHDDVAAPWTVARLAGVAGMSRAAFSAEFTRRVGRPPLAYVRAWRLTRARVALARGETSVERVASATGYTSQSAFGHAFRRAFGTSPKRALLRD